MEINFLDRVMVKSQLRRTCCYLHNGDSEKQWVIDRFKHPRRGAIIGWRTLSDGKTEHFSNEPPIYHPDKHFKAVLVVFNEKQNPVYVLPEECYEV